MEHSTVLFYDESDCKPMRFHIAPGEMRIKIRPLIEHGGGIISSKCFSDSFKLAEKNSLSGKSVEHFNVQYIFDCVKKNKLLNIEDYRFINFKDDSSGDNMSPAKNIIRGSAKSRFGRRSYTLSDDMKIINYILEEQLQSSTSGNLMWKKMENYMITNHSWESMKTRYNKIIKPRIVSYQLKKEQIFQLTNSINDDVLVSEEENNLDVTKKSFIKEKTKSKSLPLNEKSLINEDNQLRGEEEKDISDKIILDLASSVLRYLEAEAQSSVSEESFSLVPTEKNSEHSILSLSPKSEKFNLKSIESPNPKIKESNGLNHPISFKKKRKLSILRPQICDKLESPISPEIQRKLPKRFFKFKDSNKTNNIANMVEPTQSNTKETNFVNDEITQGNSLSANQTKSSPSSIKTVNQEINLLEDNYTTAANHLSSKPKEKTFELIQNLFCLTDQELSYLLWNCSNSFTDAVHYILYGISEMGFPIWSHDDDLLLSSRDCDSENLEKLIEKYGGRANVSIRTKFLASFIE